MEQEILKKLEGILAELADVKKQLADLENARYFEGWIPRKKLMEFLNMEIRKLQLYSKKKNLLYL
ncbi:MAG: hypothetical protein IPI88_10895 [Chitinophagaceae bacterium]|nr:hypothetical protein [Chitinophagaceae bacterium]